MVDATSTAVRRLVAEQFGVVESLLYARIDIVVLEDGTDVVLEVELAEPAFFLETAPDAADRFAELLFRRLDAASTLP